MSQHNSPNLKKLEVKLKNLTRCILDKAATDSEFSCQLEEILLGDSLNQVIPTRKSKPARSSFKSVDYLDKHSETKLREELNSKTDTELRQILKEESNRKVKDLKNVERQQLIDDIIANADRVLKQGSSFLQVSESVKPASSTSSAAD
ncbi:MAG: hypothetical protein NT070_13840 [Cyanobacteria bacterium]|nr:hypothetical protein [Cyanobacteriota bacterium]